MIKSKFVQQLDDLVNLFIPLTVGGPVGTIMWNGREYAKSEVDHIADATASKWLGVIYTIAGLVGGQDTPLSPLQLRFLKRELFGGMGSLNDFFIDARQMPTLPNDFMLRFRTALDELHETFTSNDE